MTLRLPSDEDLTSTGQASRKGKEKADLNGSQVSQATATLSRVTSAQSSRSRPTLSTNSSHSSSSFSSPPSSGRSTPIITTPTKESKSPFPTGRPLNGGLARTGSQGKPTTTRRSSSLRVETKGNENGHPRRHRHDDRDQTKVTRPSPPRSKSHDVKSQSQRKSIPFYISPIHPPSTNPQVSSLEEGDFAPWLSVDQFASNQVILEVWYEVTDPNHKDESHWERVDELSRTLDLGALKRVEKDTKLRENSLVLTLSTDQRSTFYFPTPQVGEEPVNPSGDEVGRKRAVSGVMERSRRETRMKKGVGLGGLHQYVQCLHCSVRLRWLTG